MLVVSSAIIALPWRLVATVASLLAHSQNFVSLRLYQLVEVRLHGRVYDLGHFGATCAGAASSLILPDRSLHQHIQLSLHCLQLLNLGLLLADLVCLRYVLWCPLICSDGGPFLQKLLPFSG